MPRRQRTRRTHQDTFTRPSPAAVTYDLSERRHATIRVPPGSSWTSGAHWHVAHTEFLQVLSGTALVTLAGLDLRVQPGDDIVTVPRGVVHEWRRADVDPWHRKDSEELVVREWTEPRDGAKEVFFRNLNGLILDEAETVTASNSGSGSAWSGALLELDLWNLFWRADNYPVVLGLGSGCIGAAATRVLMGAAVALGWVLGRPGVYDEYCAR